LNTLIVACPLCFFHFSIFAFFIFIYFVFHTLCFFYTFIVAYSYSCMLSLLHTKIKITKQIQTEYDNKNGFKCHLF
jgi:hypothetical protein